MYVTAKTFQSLHRMIWRHSTRVSTQQIIWNWSRSIEHSDITFILNFYQWKVKTLGGGLPASGTSYYPRDVMKGFHS